MTIRRRQPTRIKAAPDAQRNWEREVTDALNTLPAQSTFSYDTPEGNVPATPGTWGSNIRDDAASMWVKESGDSETGWVSVATSGAYDQISEVSTRLAATIAYGGIGAADFYDRVSGIGTDASQITAWNFNMPTKNMTSDYANGYVTVAVDGVYKVDFTSAFSGTPNTTFQMHLFVNGSENTFVGLHRKLGTGGDVGSAAYSSLVTLASGDTVTASVDVVSGSGTFIGVIDALFSLQLVEAT